MPTPLPTPFISPEWPRPSPEMSPPEALARAGKIEEGLATLDHSLALIGIGGHLAAPPLPHHRAYGFVPRWFDRVERGQEHRGGGPSKYGLRRACWTAGCPDLREKPVGEPAATAAWNFGRPRWRSSLKRLGPFCHCRQRYARSLRRIHASRLVSTRGVWQKPKYPRHPRRYGARSAIICSRLTPRVRRVISRICALNLARAFGAMRRSLPSFVMLKPRNLRSSGRATALFASLTASRSLLVRNRLTDALTRSPARRLRT